MNRALLQQALDALCRSFPPEGKYGDELEAAHRAVITLLKAELEKPEPKPVAWNVRNGLVGIAVFRYQEVAEAFATQKQKEHDLSGSLAAFKVEPLYTKGTP